LNRLIQNHLKVTEYRLDNQELFLEKFNILKNAFNIDKKGTPGAYEFNIAHHINRLHLYLIASRMGALQPAYEN
jgi:hypothetical protein